MMASSKHPILRFIVPASFLLLIGGFVAYNSSIFSSAEQPQQPAVEPAKKEVMTITVPTKKQPETAAPVTQKKPEATPALRKKNAVVIPVKATKESQLIPADSTTSIHLLQNQVAEPPREVYFPSSKSMHVEFKYTPDFSIIPTKKPKKK